MPTLTCFNISSACSCAWIPKKEPLFHLAWWAPPRQNGALVYFWIFKPFFPGIWTCRLRAWTSMVSVTKLRSLLQLLRAYFILVSQFYHEILSGTLSSSRLSFSSGVNHFPPPTLLSGSESGYLSPNAWHLEFSLPSLPFPTDQEASLTHCPLTPSGALLQVPGRSCESPCPPGSANVWTDSQSAQP